MSEEPTAPYVLVVDDEWRLGDNVARYLRRKGCQAVAVTNVTEANRVMMERRPDLALVDLKLPDVSGIDLCRRFHQRHPGVPVIVMSARIGQQDEKDLRDLGVRVFLSKPFALAELTKALDALGILSGPCGRHVGKGAVVPVRPSRRAVPPADRPAQTGTGGPRIVLYSHDTMGLGHMRRNILIARTLAESRLKANVLLVSGAREVGRFELPPGIDCLVLPSYAKSAAGAYQSRHLDLETRELVRLRAHTINVSVNAYDPDLMIVDNVPRGALDELDPVLTTLNARGKARCVLGLRDVLDEPEVVQREWRKRKNLPAIDWHYDEVWIYGDPAIYDLCQEYGFGPSFTARARFTGYLDARKRATPRTATIAAPVEEGAVEVPEQPYNLCLVGGGQDGYALARAFVQSMQPPGTVGVLIMGPFMQPDHANELRRIAAHNGALQVLGFVKEPTLLLRNARRVVAMGGYNTVNEVLAFERPTLIVPRVRPRLEQLVRAERLAELGHVDMLHPDGLGPSPISAWLASPSRGADHLRSPIDLQGLDRLTGFVETLLHRRTLNHATA